MFSYEINDDSIVYLDEYNEEKQKGELYYAGTYVQDKDKNIYAVKSNGEKEKVVQDVQSYIMTDNNVASLNSENVLYYGNKKLAREKMMEV